MGHTAHLPGPGDAATVRQWPLSGGCLSLAVCTTGKLYVADVLADRLWRVDTSTNTLLGDLPMPGAPIAVAARPCPAA